MAEKTHDYLVRRYRAGYRTRGGEEYSHEPCGSVITNPEIHDPLCPTNGRERTYPLLHELVP